MPAGKLTVHLERAKDLQFPEMHKPVAGEAAQVNTKMLVGFLYVYLINCQDFKSIK